MSTNLRIITDSLIPVLQTVEAEPDYARRYRDAQELRARADAYLRTVEDRAMYEGARSMGVTAFAEAIGVSHATVSVAVTRYIASMGAREFRPSLRLKGADPFETSYRRR